MSRRRKRKKLSSSDEVASDKPKGTPPLENEVFQPLNKASHKPEETAIQPLPLKRIDTKLTLDDELELDLSDDFGENEPSNSDTQTALPSRNDKTEMRTLRRTTDENEPDEPKEAEAEAEAEASKPQKRQRMTKLSSKTASHEDELSSLDDDAPEDAPQRSESIAKKKVTETATKPLEPTAKVEEQSLQPQRSLREITKGALNSLSLFEQASIGLLTLILITAAIWSKAIVSARIPNTIIASKLRYPLKGESVVLASYESYWRTPIRDGEDIDEGVSETIEIIPEIKISLDSKSQAKALRFLFRDEEGRYVGDSSTVKISNSQFLPSENVTSYTKGNTAIIRSTTGFEHKGELISYLADETFQWEIVILESKDGIEYTEFIAIPISANRKDNS